MNWETIITFTDSSKPFRFKVATSRAPDQAGENGKSWYKVMVNQLDESDNKVDGFDFMYNIDANRWEPELANQPILLITEQMIELVKDGKERW